MTIEEVCKKDIIIFGASKAGEKVFRILSEMNYNIKFFVDNDSNKWGKTFYGKTIYNPKELLKTKLNNDIILIGSMYVKDISQQLNDMGLEGLYEDSYDFIYKIVKNNGERFVTKSTELGQETNSVKDSYLISLPNGLVLGGLEVWSINTYSLLSKKAKKVFLFSLTDEVKTKLITSEYDTYNLISISSKDGKFYEHINNIIQKIIKYSPSIVVPHYSEEVFLACQIIKQFYNIKIKVISILHGDMDFSYSQNLRYDEIIDKFICVSDEIKERLVEKLPHRERDIYTLITPVRNESYTRTYSNNAIPIRIGYVGRLVKPDKRADLLIELIEALENRNLKYQFEIGGEGEYYEILKEYIETNMIQERVKLLGGIPNHLIYKFWRDKDIFINVSDSEGTSISMLEGLYNGAVPVLTDVSGVRKFVKHRVNGFIVNTGDIEAMVDYIQYLDRNRDLLQLYGENIHKRVSEICNPDKFIEEFIKICEVY